MDQLNIVGFDSPFGYKTFELWQGDLLNPLEPFDLLVVSVARGSYAPVSGTLVEGLWSRYELRVDELRAAAELDAESALDFWVSRELQFPVARRLLCLELDGRRTDPDAAMESLFVALAVLEAKGIPLGAVALPLLGTGSQRINPEGIVSGLLGRVQPFLVRSAEVKKLMLVDRHEERARLLDQEIDRVLRRPMVTLPQGELVKSLRAGLAHQLDRVHSVAGEFHTALLSDLRHTVMDDQARYYEVGIVGRRLAEAVVDSVLGAEGGGHLFNDIGALSKHDVASWIVSYLHLLRVFGNEAAHEPGEAPTTPPEVRDQDLIVCYVCMERILDFWHGLLAAGL